MKKADFILIGVILAVALAVLGYRQLTAEDEPTAWVVVKVGRTEYGRYDLNKDQTVVIESDGGGTNTLVIENGAASVTDANCPDKLCVYQADISVEGATIVCLPHLVVVSIESGGEAEVDGVAG